MEVGKPAVFMETHRNPGDKGWGSGNPVGWGGRVFFALIMAEGLVSPFRWLCRNQSSLNG